VEYGKGKEQGKMTNTDLDAERDSARKVYAEALVETWKDYEAAWKAWKAAWKEQLANVGLDAETTMEASLKLDEWDERVP